MIAECLTLLEAGNVLYSSCSDVFQSLAREESLVARDDHIWKSEQPREHVIAENQPRMSTASDAVAEKSVP
jgi:hypothetical protein